jgi:ribosomal protein S18 acetylase RimI-like enzyme
MGGDSPKLSGALTVELATPGDGAVLSRIATESFQAAYEDQLPAQLIAAHVEHQFGQQLLEQALADATRIFLVARRDGRAVGFGNLAVSGNQAPPQGRGTVELERFYLFSEVWGQGVAPRLLDKLTLIAGESLEAAAVRLQVWKANARAIAFFKRHGFLKTGSEPVSLESQLFTYWTLTRRLQPARHEQPPLLATESDRGQSSSRER